MYCEQCGELVEVYALERGEPLPANADPAVVRAWWAAQPTTVLSTEDAAWDAYMQWEFGGDA